MGHRHASYKRQRRNAGVTEIVKIPNRGHALTIDHGWREVAQTALDFVKRSLPGDGARQTTLVLDEEERAVEPERDRELTQPE